MGDTLAIDSRQIQLWLVAHDQVRDPALLREYEALLAGEERQRRASFRFERDRHRYLVTRALARVVLSKYAAIAPQEWRFEANPYGRPTVANKNARAGRIAFNLSHTSGLSVLGVTRDGAIGVDVESAGVQHAAVEIVDRFFAPEEVAALRELPSAEQRARFVEYWTLKESYIKARGMGSRSRSTASVSISLAPASRAWQLLRRCATFRTAGASAVCSDYTTSACCVCLAH